MKCCGVDMEKIEREDAPGVFLICHECFTVLCPESVPPIRVTEIGRR